MRCITLTDRAFDGIRLREHKGKYVVDGPDGEAMAFVSFRSFEEMVKLGHASHRSQPQRFEKVGKLLGLFESVPVIYRCSYETAANENIWLISESEDERNTKDVLVMAPRFCCNRTTMECVHMPSRTLVQKVNRLSNTRYNLMHLVAEYPANCYSNGHSKKPGTGRSLLKPLRKAEYQLDMIPRRSIVVDRDGVVSITRPNTKMVFWH